VVSGTVCLGLVRSEARFIKVRLDTERSGGIWHGQRFGRFRSGMAFTWWGSVLYGLVGGKVGFGKERRG
jgi:hypothetical protein